MQLNISDKDMTVTLEGTIRLPGCDSPCGLMQRRMDLLNRVGLQFDRAVMDALNRASKGQGAEEAGPPQEVQEEKKPEVQELQEVQTEEARQEDPQQEALQEEAQEEARQESGENPQEPQQEEVQEKPEEKPEAEEPVSMEEPSAAEEAHQEDVPDKGEDAADAEDRGGNAPRKGRRRIDMGKVMALRRAGWSNTEIAGEMGISTQSVANAVCAYKKKHSAPAVT